MIRKCDLIQTSEDLRQIWAIINDAAQIYRQIIPAEHFQTPYMSQDELEKEIANGITFWGYQEEKKLVGVMGVQPKGDVTLIRHAYVLPTKQHQGIGGRLLGHIYQSIPGPVLIGTWSDATWAVRFYQKHGFQLVPKADTMDLLNQYWTAAQWHKEKSVVLGDPRWFHQTQAGKRSQP